MYKMSHSTATTNNISSNAINTAVKDASNRTSIILNLSKNK